MPALSARSLLACSGILAATLAQAAQPAPILSCKADAQQACTASGCEAQLPVTQAVLDLGIRGDRPVFCYGTACWRTEWSRADTSARNRVALAMSARASFNGVPARLLLQAAILTDGLRFQASVMDGPGSVQVFSGSCTARGRGRPRA